MSKPLPELHHLSVSERLQLVQDLWDSIATEPESVPVTEAQERELERRLSAYREDRNRGASWAKVRERLRDDQ